MGELPEGTELTDTEPESLRGAHSVSREWTVMVSPQGVRSRHGNGVGAEIPVADREEGRGGV